MKIADISEFYSERGGGVRTYVQQKLAASARLGHETLIIAPGPSDREDKVPGGRIIWVKAPVLAVDPRYHIFTGLDGVRAVLERELPDIVEGSSPWRGGWAAARWSRPGIKALFMHADPVAVYPQTLLGGLIGRARVDWLFGWFWAYLRRLNAPFDATIVAGEWLARRFESFGLKNLFVVPMGVDRTLFHPARRSDDVRGQMLAACGLTENDHLLISVGRHHPEKRLPVVMDAAAFANQRLASQKKRVGLYLVGDGLLRKAIEKKAATIPHVHVAGQIADRAHLAACLASADGLLHASTSETYGIAVAEALCCGTPVVVPDVGGAGDFADPAASEVYPAGDAAAGGRAVLRLLARAQPALRSGAMSYAAVKIGPAEAHFDRLFALYADLLAAKRKA